MKTKLYVYFIDAEPMNPVGNAGAVVIAETPQAAKDLAGNLQDAKEPELIGKADSSYKEPKVVFFNNGDY